MSGQKSNYSRFFILMQSVSQGKKGETAGPLVIGHFLLSLGKGGMENGIVKLVNNSLSSRFKHVIICLLDDISLQDRITNPNVEILIIGRNSILNNIKNLSQCIQNKKINILHSRGWPTMFEGAAVKLLNPSVKTVFGFHGRAYNELGAVNWPRKIMQIVLARLFDRLNTLTPFMRRELSKEFKISEKKIVILPNGVAFHNAQKNNDHNQELRRELNIQEEDVVFGYVGRLDRVKGIDVIIKAFDLYYKNNKQSALIIVGEGELADTLKLQAEKLSCAKRILFAGFTNNISHYMGMFNIYLQASIYEGLSNTILEAMSYGLPIICTNAGGNNDIITHEENGYLIEVNSDEKMAIFMSLLSQNKSKRAEMSKNNSNKIKNHYSLDEMVKNYEKLYKNLI